MNTLAPRSEYASAFPAVEPADFRQGLKDLAFYMAMYSMVAEQMWVRQYICTPWGPYDMILAFSDEDDLLELDDLEQS